VADISMCQDKQCPSGDDCYRFTADPNPHWQSYFMISPRSANARSCEFYIPAEVPDDKPIGDDGAAS